MQEFYLVFWDGHKRLIENVLIEILTKYLKIPTQFQLGNCAHFDKMIKSFWFISYLLKKNSPTELFLKDLFINYHQL